MADHQPSESHTHSLAQTSAVVLGALYLFGFFVVSLYLANFGIHTVSLLRVQYLAAGFFSLGPLVLIYFLASLFHMGFDKLFRGPLRIGSFPSSTWPRVRWVCFSLLRILWEITVALVVGSFILVAVVSIFVPNIVSAFWSNLKFVSDVVRTSVLPVLGLLWIFRAKTLLDEQERKSKLRMLLEFGLPTTLSLWFFLAYMNFFANEIYPKIPFAIGGGKPQSIVFLLKSHSDAAPPPIKPDESLLRSIPYELILQTDTSFVVLSHDQNEKAIELSRDAVQGIVVLRKP